MHHSILCVQNLCLTLVSGIQPPKQMSFYSVGPEVMTQGGGRKNDRADRCWNSGHGRYDSLLYACVLPSVEQKLQNISRMRSYGAALLLPFHGRREEASLISSLQEGLRGRPLSFFSLREENSEHQLQAAGSKNGKKWKAGRRTHIEGGRMFHIVT